MFHQKKLDLPCGGGLFSCIDKSKCLLPLQRCDGDEQCSDGSDEWECPKDEDGQLPPYARAPKIPKQSQQNEWKGPKPKKSNWKCPDNLFTCSNKQCILLQYQCDGKNDCSDGSDEIACTDKNYEHSNIGRTPPHTPQRNLVHLEYENEDLLKHKPFKHNIKNEL